MQKYQYRAIHTAIVAAWGRPKTCRLCGGKHNSKRYEWSNKNHKYTLLKRDWWELCSVCHRQYDRKKFGWTTWNKGLSGRQKNHNTLGLLGGGWNRGKKETRPEVLEKMKKSHLGKIPWNKGKTYKQKKNLLENNLISKK